MLDSEVVVAGAVTALAVSATSNPQYGPYLDFEVLEVVKGRAPSRIRIWDGGFASDRSELIGQFRPGSFVAFALASYKAEPDDYWDALEELGLLPAGQPRPAQGDFIFGSCGVRAAPIAKRKEVKSFGSRARKRLRAIAQSQVIPAH
jgi:hypothetical protein